MDSGRSSASTPARGCPGTGEGLCTATEERGRLAGYGEGANICIITLTSSPAPLSIVGVFTVFVTDAALCRHVFNHNGADSLLMQVTAVAPLQYGHAFPHVISCPCCHGGPFPRPAPNDISSTAVALMGQPWARLILNPTPYPDQCPAAPFCQPR